jgi:hypothetical protein
MRMMKQVVLELGRGLLAGLAGTAAMTISTTIEMKLRRRPPSRAPAEAAKKLLRLRARSEKAERRLANLVHWSYGTFWGVARAAVGAAGLRGFAAPAAHFGILWGSALVALPAIGVAPPVYRWPPAEIGTDLVHHAVYVAASDAAYRVLARW